MKNAFKGVSNKNACLCLCKKKLFVSIHKNGQKRSGEIWLRDPRSRRPGLTLTSNNFQEEP